MHELDADTREAIAVLYQVASLALDSMDVEWWIALVPSHSTAARRGPEIELRVAAEMAGKRQKWRVAFTGSGIRNFGGDAVLMRREMSKVVRSVTERMRRGDVIERTGLL